MKSPFAAFILLTLLPRASEAQQESSLTGLASSVESALEHAGSSKKLGKMKLGGVTLHASEESGFDVSIASANDAGCGMTRVVLLATQSASRSIDAGNASVEKSEGSSARYTAILPDAVARDVANGNAAPPSPFDLDSLPSGASVEIEQQTFSALGLSATFRNLTASVKNTTGEANVVSVTRLADGTVRVTAGPRREVARAESYGVSLGVANAGITSSASVTNGSLVSWDFDVATSEGAAAYAALLETGSTPATAEARRTIRTVSQGSGAYLGAGGVDLHVDVSHGEATTIVTETSDGRTTKTLRANVQGAPFEITRTFAGSQLSDLAITIPLPALSAADREDLEAALGTRLPSGALSLSLRGNEWENFRDRLAARCGRNCSGAAAATTPEEFALLLSRKVKMGGSGLYEEMALASLDANHPLFAGAITGTAAPSCPAASELSVIDSGEAGGANVDRFARTFSPRGRAALALRADGAGTRR